MRDGQAPESWLARLLRVPLFYKILIANAAIVAVGVFGGAWLVGRLAASGVWTAVELVLVLGGIGVLISVAINAAILRLALSPLARLEETVRHVQAGDLSMRTPRSPLADRDLERLVVTVNDMLDRLEDYHGRLREVARRALGAEEEERKRLARELHDGTLQELSALKVRLALARSVEDTEARAAALDEVRDGLAAAAEAVRRFAHGLRPPQLDELGLRSALEAYARNVAEICGVEVEVRGPAADARLGPEEELVLYRIAQEALTNATRHGAPSRVCVTLAQEGGEAVLTVRDDGRGFVPAEVERSPGRGLGLFGMRERVAHVAGTLAIHSRPGAGTTLEARVGLRPPAAVRVRG